MYQRLLFRGLTAAASLKPIQGLGERLHRCHPPLPRPHRRGLIEAPTAAAPAPAACCRPLPRPHRRGLIEASEARASDARNIIQLFRGLTAAASLKPRRRRPPAAHRAPLPRPHRRGLIEADTRSTCKCRCGSLFRGLTAAASLKRVTRATDRAGCAARLFRGLTAAASLKPICSATYSSEPMPSSAASPPRPH